MQLGRSVALTVAPLVALIAPAHAQQTVTSSEVIGVDGVVRREVVRFAVIGDYGDSGTPEADVAALVKTLDPDFVLTVGDNNYPDGEASTIDANIGQYYEEYIHPYQGAFGPGSAVNRFFPAPGNHDWHTPGIAPYLSYFTLPGNERYYTFQRGNVRFYSLDSDSDEPDGYTPGSLQAQWLEAQLAASTATYDVVYLHHTPYSSSDAHGPDPERQWDFLEWGADVVLAGHDHLYERVHVGGLPYFTNGLGGRPVIHGFQDTIAGSRLRFNGDYGAMIVDVDTWRLRARFVTRGGIVVDEFPVFADDASQPAEVLVPGESTWRYLDDGTFPGSDWMTLGFDDAGWASGPAQLGYGEGDEATVVSYGPDASDKYVTTYFRHDFQVVDPATFTSLRLDLLRDDGAIVYLNGVEVHRVNLPASGVTSTTLATGTVSGDPEESFYEVVPDPGLLLVGTNVVAVEIHQTSVTSSDISFDLILSGFRDTLALVPMGSAWRYLDDGTDPGPAWTAPAFDDAAWSQGPAELGYGDGDEATVVDYGPDPFNKHVTTYFRRAFEVPAAADWNALVLRLVRDDGVAVYLNGTEVYRHNLPIGALAFDTSPGFDVSNAVEDDVIETRVDPRLLADGTNQLAVEMHQFLPFGFDLSFDLELIGRP